MITKSEKADAYPWEVGMVVACTGSGLRGGDVRIGKILRLTKVRVIVDFKSHQLDFNRHHGQHRYDAYNWSSIRPATQEDYEKIKHKNLSYRLSHVKWSELSLCQLERIAAMLEGKSLIQEK